MLFLRSTFLSKISIYFGLGPIIKLTRHPLNSTVIQVRKFFTMSRTWAQVVSTPKSAGSTRQSQLEIDAIGSKWQIHKNELAEHFHQVNVVIKPIQHYLFMGVFCGGYTSGMAGAIARSEEEAIYFILSQYLAAEEYEAKSAWIRSRFWERVKACYGEYSNGLVLQERSGKSWDDWYKILEDEIKSALGSLETPGHEGLWEPKRLVTGEYGYCTWAVDEPVYKSLVTQLWEMMTEERVRVVIKPIDLGVAFYCGGGD